jgi:hypothetical protein
MICGTIQSHGGQQENWFAIRSHLTMSDDWKIRITPAMAREWAIFEEWLPRDTALTDAEIGALLCRPCEDIDQGKLMFAAADEEAAQSRGRPQLPPRRPPPEPRTSVTMILCKPA